MKTLIVAMAALLGACAFGQVIPDWAEICSASGDQVDANFTRNFGMPGFCALSVNAQRSQLNKGSAAVRELFNRDCVSMFPRKERKGRVCFRPVEGYRKNIVVADNHQETVLFTERQRGPDVTLTGSTRTVVATYHPRSQYGTHTRDGHRRWLRVKLVRLVVFPDNAADMTFADGFDDGHEQFWFNATMWEANVGRDSHSGHADVPPTYTKVDGRNDTESRFCDGGGTLYTSLRSGGPTRHTTHNHPANDRAHTHDHEHGWLENPDEQTHAHSWVDNRLHNFAHRYLVDNEPVDGC